MEECQHKQTTNTDSGVLLCLSCGLELQEEYTHDQDWRFYKENDNKNNSDPSRCQFKRIVDKGIKKDLERLGFSHDIIELADQYYNEVTNGEIKRSNLRKGIMFACVFEAGKVLGKYEIPDDLCGKDKFDIDRKSMSKGLTFFHLGKKKNTEEDKTYITAKHFIPKVLSLFRVREEHEEKILELYDKIEHKSRIINTSNPQSVSAGLVYYYFKQNKIDIQGSKFGRIVKLSEITITRIADEIEDFFNSQPQNEEVV